MKILLLGEYSGLHKNLKEGLVALGHDVTIASTGDGFKKIKPDIDLKVDGNLIVKSFKKVKQRFYLLNLVKEYDLVQLMNPFLFYNNLFPNIWFFNKLINNSNKFFILAAGDDSYFWRVGREKLSYSPFKDFLKYDLVGAKSFFMESDKAFKVNSFVANKVDGIIPIMYEYECSYEGHRNLKNTIPIPINTSKISYKENIVADKIVIFHGLNRYGFKGTRHVEEAFSILRKKYPNELELIIKGGIPLKDYLNLMSKTNIVIDQMNSYSLGVNGIYAMAMGKVVLGGAEPEALKSHGVTFSPVINLKPSAESIVFAVEEILLNKEKIKELGIKSRKYAEKIHGHIKIAERYVETWSKKLK